MPSCRGVTYWSSLKGDQPILLLGKSHLQRSNAAGWILPPFWTRIKLSKTSSKPWASSSLAGRPRPEDYEWFLTRASAVSRARLRAQGCPEQLGRKEGTILPAGTRPGAQGAQAVPAPQSVYSATMDRRTVMSSGFPPAKEAKTLLFHQTPLGCLLIICGIPHGKLF